MISHDTRSWWWWDAISWQNALDWWKQHLGDTIGSWALLKFNSPTVSYSKFSHVFPCFPYGPPESQKAERRVANKIATGTMNFSRSESVQLRLVNTLCRLGPPFPGQKLDGWRRDRSSHVNWFENVWSGFISDQYVASVVKCCRHPWRCIWELLGAPDSKSSRCSQDVKGNFLADRMVLWPKHSKNPMFFIFVVYVSYLS